MDEEMRSHNKFASLGRSPIPLTSKFSQSLLFHLPYPPHSISSFLSLLTSQTLLFIPLPPYSISSFFLPLSLSLFLVFLLSLSLSYSNATKCTLNKAGIIKLTQIKTHLTRVQTVENGTNFFHWNNL
uniref:Uncharacterized protein n=1 Tax=Cacopsylla melanoneura TaxID=428564 RepID=A0A8D9FBW6_9HEMI